MRAASIITQKRENMTTPFMHHLRSSLTILPLALIHPSCTGTEADNPFTDPTMTSLCKGDEEYVPLGARWKASSLGTDWSAPALSAQASPGESLLSPLSEIPVWLECVEWELREGVLDYQIANFRGGCEVTWEGGGRVTSDGDVVVELANNSCSVALCGNCLYDLRSGGQLEMPDANESVHFELVRKDCEGDVTVTSKWQLPVGESPHGMLCRPADRWGAESSVGNASSNVDVDLYAPCGEDSMDELAERSCAEGLTCVSGNCVPACMSDEECPLSGALTCQEGHCLLSE
jgi:hypothetical protein